MPTKACAHAFAVHAALCVYENHNQVSVDNVVLFRAPLGEKETHGEGVQDERNVKNRNRNTNALVTQQRMLIFFE